MPATERIAPTEETFAPVAVGEAVAVPIEPLPRPDVVSAPLPVPVSQVEAAIDAPSGIATANGAEAVPEPIPTPAPAPAAAESGGPTNAGDTAAVADTPAAPTNLDAVLEASGLVLVQTDPTRSAQPSTQESPPPVLGRRPRPPVTIADEPLQQVETQK